MPRWIGMILENGPVGACARILATFMFWSSGYEKLVGFPASVQEMAQHGLEPAVFFAALTTLSLLGGPLLIIWGRYAWLGAGWLGVFTVLTIPIAHNFWSGPPAERMAHLRGAREHLTVVGGLFFVAAVCWRNEMARRARRQG